MRVPRGETTDDALALLRGDGVWKVARYSTTTSECMRSRWPLLAILCVLASLLVPGIASASTAAGTETRVGAFDPQEQAFVGDSAYDRLASDSLLAARGGLNVGSKVAKQMGPRGWTREAIDDAINSGNQVKAFNRATGNPATRYLHPKTGQSVVVDNVTGEVIHVGGPRFKYGPGSGDLP